MTNKVKIAALGGLDEDGKNLYILEINDDIFVFECGMKFPELHNTGIDMIVPDVSYLIKNKDKVKAYFISHGHDDIMGGLPYIISKVPAPIYCSYRTSHMINLTTKRFKQNVSYDFHIVNSGTKEIISGHEVIFFSTTHSAKSSLGIAIETGDGLVVYTGDFIFDYEANTHYRCDVNLLGELGNRKVLALLSESISCQKEGHTSPLHRMTPYLDNILSNANEGRIYISLYYQNSYGFREIIDACVRHNKKVFIYGKEMKDLISESSDVEFRNQINKISCNEYELDRIGNENIVVIVAGQGEHLFSVLAKMASGEDNLFSIKSKDNVIIASPEVPGVEVFSSKVIDDIYRTGAKITNLKKLGVVSMHARVEDIKMMISIFKPKYYLPVKGQYQNLLANAKIALNMGLGYNYSNVLLFDNGLVGLFEDGEFKGVSEKIELVDVMIDGLIVGDIVSSVINDRERLGDDGVITLGICVDSVNKQIISGPDIQMRGLIFIKDSDNELIKELATTYDSDVQDFLNKGTIHSEDAINRIHDKLDLIIKRKTGKDPILIPIITDVAKK